MWVWTHSWFWMWIPGISYCFWISTIFVAGVAICVCLVSSSHHTCPWKALTFFKCCCWTLNISIASEHVGKEAMLVEFIQGTRFHHWSEVAHNTVFCWWNGLGGIFAMNSGAITFVLRQLQLCSVEQVWPCLPFGCRNKFYKAYTR